MPAAGTYSIVNYVREGLRGPFKAKNFLPAAGTYIVVNWERGLFQSQNFSACGRHLRCCELREGALSKPKRSKKFCLRQALVILWTMYVRERLRGPFKSQKGQKFSACGRHLHCHELRERPRVPFQGKKRPKSFCLRQAIILLWNERKDEGEEGQEGQKFSACGSHL